MALCPGGGEAATLRAIIEACESERRRLGGDLANATDEDVRLFALFSTAAKCFLCRAWEEDDEDDEDDDATRDALVNQVLRRVWLPLLADDARASASRSRVDDGTRRQVIDECVAALRCAHGAGDVFRRATTRALTRVFGREAEAEAETETREDTVTNASSNALDDLDPEFGAMRFETALELAVALLRVAAAFSAEGTAEDKKGRARVVAPAAAAAAEALSSISRWDVEGMDATRWRRVLACLAPAAIDVCARHGAKPRALDRARFAFGDVVFDRVRRAQGRGDFEAYFFDMLRLDATRDLLLGPPGTARAAFETRACPAARAETTVRRRWFEGEAFAPNGFLARVLARGVASDERERRVAALAAIRHGLGVSEETGVWAFDESPWCEFAAVVDALEDFAAHLVDAAWKHMDALHPPAAARASGNGGVGARAPYRFVVSAWTRGLRHANPAVRSKTLETFRAREWRALRLDASPACGLTDAREVRDSIADSAEFVTETLVRAAMGAPRGDEKVKDFLRVYVEGGDSRATSGAMRRVTEVVAEVGRCAATANTVGLDVGTNIVGHAARAYKSAFGDAWSYRREAEIGAVLDALGDCAAALLAVARNVDPETLANRARVVFDAARILAPFACADAVARKTFAVASGAARRDDERLECFRSFLRLLRVAPSAAVDGDGPESVSRARAAAAAWLKAPSTADTGHYDLLCRACIVACVDACPTNDDADDEDDPREARMRAAATRARASREDDGDGTEARRRDETAATLADADALARAWSFVQDGSSKKSDAFVRRVLRVLSAPESRDSSAPDDPSRRVASPAKRRALLVFRAAFRLAGGLERAAAKRGAAALECSGFLAATRAAFRFCVRDSRLMQRVVSAAARDVAFGNPESGARADASADASARDALGWSEAVFRWAPTTANAVVSREDFATLMRVGAETMRALSERAAKPGSEVSARRRGDVALALASAARGVAALASASSAPRDWDGETTREDLVASASRCLAGIERSLDALERDAEASPADVAFAVVAAWTATRATLASASPLPRAKRDDGAGEDGVATASALLRRAVAFLPTAARVGADATATTFRAIATLVTRVAADARDPPLAETAKSIFDGSSDFLFGSSAFRKNAPVWAAAASAALHPAFFDAGGAGESPKKERPRRAANLEAAHASGDTVGACVAFVRGATSLSRASGGARAARVVARALAARLTRHPEYASAYAREIFELGLAGEGEQTRGISSGALNWKGTRTPEGGETALASRDDAASPDVAARVAALVLAHALAAGAPPAERVDGPEATFSSREDSASRRGARAILRVALEAVAGADEVLARETYRRGSPTHRRKVRAWQMLCACAPALGKTSLTGIEEEERLDLITKLIASAPACLSRRELPGVRYYAETFHCLAAMHAPALVARCAVPALRAPETKPFVAASWIVVATSAALRRRRNLLEEERIERGLLTDARRVFAAVFPLAMSHNHTLRVFAQAATRDLLEAFSPSAFSRSFGTRSPGATRDQTASADASAGASEDASEDALETTLLVLTTDAEMLKTREACGNLFTQSLDASPRALLRGALDIEPLDRESETIGTETETETDDVAFEGAPASAIDRVDAFLQSARSEIRAERERAEATLWRDAMRGGHDARGKVTGVVGDDAAALDDDAAEDETTRVSASALQKKVVGGTSRREVSSVSVGHFPNPDATERHESVGMSRSDANAGRPGIPVLPVPVPVPADREPPPAAAAARAPDGLVVVASLVEKIPNLAGLARTCEVLGAARLVVADLAATKHRDFTSISVTAEKWLRVDACPIAGLAAYLARLRREGYALVGLEQTRGSADVETHGWARKTALVLGREREGVDAHILGMLDACVVIRQRGMIRSLNVHVSASIAVARYAAAAARNGW